MNDRVATHLRRRGATLIRLIEHIGLLVVLAAVLVASGQEIFHMVRAGHVSVPDLLLLFIYLELITMSSVYWRVGRLPVRMPLYIAMVAIARHLMLESDKVDTVAFLGEGGTILLLALAVLVVRFGHTRFPYRDEGSVDIG